MIHCIHIDEFEFKIMDQRLREENVFFMQELQTWRKY